MNTNKQDPVHRIFRSRTGRHLLRWLYFLATVVLAAVPPTFAGTWTALNNQAPGGIGLMVLLSDGTVMAKSSNGGSDGYGNIWYRLTPSSTGSYVNGTWTALAPMNYTRLYGATQVLTDGRVFVAGGEYGTGGATAEVYNPLTNSWLVVPSAGVNFIDSNSEILPNGQVLVGPVGSEPATKIYDPVANTWTTGPSANGDFNESAWVKLPDDSILFVDIGSTNAERYIPALNKWIIDAFVPVSLYDPYGFECGPGVLLPNGKVIMFGGTGHTAIYTPSGSTANGSWVVGPDIPNGQAMPDAPCVLMANGNVLIAVCPIPTSTNQVFQPPTTFYEYNYTTNSFTSVPTPTGGTMNYASYYGTMLGLPDGTALYSNFTNQIYSYQNGGTPVTGTQPTISGITQNADGSYHLVGTQLNGVSEGSEYGDDNQNATNYPIVRLSAGSNVYYLRTYNWSSTSVATGSTPVTTEFSVPVNVPPGSYSLVVVANGIASAPVAFTVLPPALSVSPATGLASSGQIGGPFSPTSQIYTLTNNSASSLNWTASTNQGWVSASPPSGTLGAGANVQVTVAIASAANSLNAGSYSATASFTDTTNGPVIVRAVSLTVTAALSVSPATGLTSAGQIGGPFSPTSQIYTLTNNSASSLNWSATTNQGWLSASPASGTLGAGANVQVTVAITSAANFLNTGSYSATASFTDVTNGPVLGRAVSLTVAAARIAYFPLDTDPGWTRQGQWAFGTPTGAGGASHGNHDPTSGATGSNVFGVNLSGDYSITIGGPYYLTTGAISTSGYTGTQLRFKRWLNTDYPSFVYATIDVSSDGTNWTNIFTNVSGVAISDNSWTTQTYTLGAAFDNKPTIYLRWGHRIGSSGAFAYSGWNIDDIEILGTPSSSNANLANLVLSAGTLTPAFSSSTTSYTAAVPYATSSVTVTPTVVNGAATVKVNSNTVASGAASGPVSLAIGSNSIPTVVTAQDGVTTQTYAINLTRLTNLQGWRQTYFGSTSNSSNAANTADSDADGLPNLIEFATNTNPTVASVRPWAVVLNGSNLEFTYTRSDAALTDGVTFTVEWSDTLLPGSWSGTGVTENILSDNGTVQQVKALVPIGSSTGRCMHLKVTSPTSN